jgi:hypothetical protein
MKYTEKNKLQYFEKNNRKNYKIIVKMFGRHFLLQQEFINTILTNFIELSMAHLLKQKSRCYHLLKPRYMQNIKMFVTFLLY